ncbi:MAG: PEP-CTERM sorting domain-containing protein [Candidatus Omnitrophica bacterium]|nr:PEP-CTERM sorting domain-containing protein [Candidatus Omnitrophota bacterium]
MKFLIGFRIILILMIMVASSGCKLKWSDSDGLVESNQTLTGSEQKDESSESDGFSITPDDETPIDSDRNPQSLVGFSITPEEEMPIVPEKNSQPLDDCKPVPEPMTLFLLGPALISLFAVKRKSDS